MRGEDWKSASAGRRRQHARRVCSPESRSRTPVVSGRFIGRLAGGQRAAFDVGQEPASRQLPGSAPVPGAGRGVPPRRTLRVESPQCATETGSPRRRDTDANTRDACAPRSCRPTPFSFSVYTPLYTALPWISIRRSNFVPRPIFRARFFDACALRPVFSYWAPTAPA